MTGVPVYQILTEAFHEVIKKSPYNDQTAASQNKNHERQKGAPFLPKDVPDGQLQERSCHELKIPPSPLPYRVAR
jgi:hypothetical protein